MTAPALRQLRAALERALADPAIATSRSREERLRKAAAVLERAAADVPPQALGGLEELFADAVLGHPGRPDTVLGRIAAGLYRTRAGQVGRQLTPASQRDIMDGIADLNRAAGRPAFGWQARGMRPWSKHTKEPLDFTGHIVLRRALSTPVEPRREPYRLRLLAALEVLWATAVPREGLVAADVTDLSAQESRIRLTVNLPGRTAATRQDFALPRSARTALRLWLPVRREVVARHLDAGPDHPANQALFVTLRHTVAEPASGAARMVPPGIRITGNGLETDYSKWARGLNGDHAGQKGWPVPTDLYTVSRGGAVRREAQGRSQGRGPARQGGSAGAGPRPVAVEDVLPEQ
ncbi:hypothetical protein [Actinacidiphila glaucinigra]|uniref:hypothetical protein n=1 Tax=Actinacidiphila glaucinigra TaxID=235986 RepID=UPI00367301AB